MPGRHGPGMRLHPDQELNMKELNAPPPHQPLHPHRRSLKVEHELTEEENITTDAPDVEGHTMIKDLRHSPAVRHPKAF